MEIPQDLTGLRTALGGDAIVPEDHFLTRLCQDFPSYSRWLDYRFQRVFGSSRFQVEPGRLDQMRNKLLCSKTFMSAEVEVQAAATLLRWDTAMILAPHEGNAPVSDFTAYLPREVSVEVRMLFEPEDELAEEAAATRIRGRIERLSVPPNALVTTQVRRIRDASRRFLIDARSEKLLVRCLERALEEGTWRDRRIHITLLPGKDPVVWQGDSSLHGEIASIGIQFSQSFRGGFAWDLGHFRPPSDRNRTEKALKKKSSRKQRVEGRPWVVVLNTSGSMLTELEEIQLGANDYFRGADGNMSGVVIQRRQYGLTRCFGAGHNGRGGPTFCSIFLPNRGALNPLTSAEAAMFIEHTPSSRD